jgi:hypothetical protein
MGFPREGDFELVTHSGDRDHPPVVGLAVLTDVAEIG